MTGMQDGEVSLCGSVQYECNDVVTAVCSDAANGLVWLGLRSGSVRAVDTTTSEVVCEIPLQDDRHFTSNSSSSGAPPSTQADHGSQRTTEVKFLVPLGVERRSSGAAVVVGATAGGFLFIVKRCSDRDDAEKARWVARSLPSDSGTLPLCATDVSAAVLSSQSAFSDSVAEDDSREAGDASGLGGFMAALTRPGVAFAVGYDNGAVVVWAEHSVCVGSSKASDGVGEFRASGVYTRPSSAVDAGASPSASCTALAVLRKSLASDDTRCSDSGGPTLLAAYSGGGVIAFWSLSRLGSRGGASEKADSLMYTTAPLFPTGADVSVMAVVSSVDGGDGASPAHIWVGSSRGDVAVLDAESGSVVRSSSHLYDRKVVCVSSFGDGYVWTAAEDGRATVWDTCSSTLTAAYELLHPCAIVGCVLATQSLVRRVHLVGADAFAQIYAAQSSAGLDDSSAQLQSTQQLEVLGRMLDDSLRQARHWQGEARRSTMAKLDAQARERHDLSGAEQRQRGIIVHVWADATESLFVGFLLAAKTLRGLSAEADALRAERDYFQAMLASMSAAHQARPSVSSPIARRPTTTTATVATTSTHTSPLSHQLHASPSRETVAALMEKDAQIRMLQTELLHLRCECDTRSEHQERERVREATTLRSLANEQARQVQQIRDDLLVKDAVLKDCRQELSVARSECKALTEELRELRSQVSLRDTALERKQSDITALQVELNEIRLEVQMTAAREETEKLRLQRDLDAMRAPWAAMKQSLHDARTEVDMIKHQCAMRIDQLQAKLAQKDRELAALRRTNTIR